MKVGLLFILVLLVSANACAPKIYQAPDFEKNTRRHKLVAVLPANVSLKLRPNQMKKMTQEQIVDEEMKTGYEIQNAIYGWLLRRSGKFAYTVRFQDVTKTNSILKESGIEYADIPSKDRAKLAQILGVDAIIQDHTSMEKPMSEGAAIVLGALLGFWGSTNQVMTNIDIHDGDSGDLLWKFDYHLSGSAGSTPNQLVNALMRSAARKFPYQKSK